MIASLATLVQAYLLPKILFIAIFVGSASLDALLNRTFPIYPRLLFFYLVQAAAGIVWASVGLMNPASYEAGVMDAIRLYSIWSLVFFVLYNFLRARQPLVLFHRAMILAGIAISVINITGVLDEIYGMGLFSEDARKELDQYIGVHDGFIQITSQNIGSLFFITPYLVSLGLRNDGDKAPNGWEKLALILCLILTVISGRRALLIIVALTPCIVLVVSCLDRSISRLKRNSRRFLVAYTACAVAAAGVVGTLPGLFPEVPFAQRITEAFSSVDERSIQKPYLIEAFEREPFVGSGFGASASYLRNDERPWTGYELTYYQMLFNIGVVGTLTIACLFLLYFARVIVILRQQTIGSTVPFGLLVGYISLLLGAYSNRYLGSFDLLFFVGLLPYLSTFRAGFPQLEAGAKS